MRTSQQQFEMLITFMEEHGDLNKPCKTPRGRLANINRWEELTNLLNADGTGDTKSAEKWKKVWSDFKNNCKKKAARLHRAAGGTGGGPAIYSKLTDLENRALKIIGVEAATGLPIAEAGFSQNVNIVIPISEPAESQPPRSPQLQNQQNEDIEIWNEPGPSSRVHVVPPPAPATPISPTRPTTTSPTLINVDDLIMADFDNRAAGLSPSRVGQTASPRRTTPRRRARAERRRQLLPSQSQEAAAHFLRSDAEWRQMRLQQHQDELEMRREHIRVRELELQSQRSRVLDLVEKVVNKFCNN